MSAEIPSNNPEKKEKLDDNARKFLTGTLDPEFLEVNGASSFTLTVDWLEIGEDNETKIAHKKFDNSDIQILLITKTTLDGHRTSEKEKITEEKYRELLALSILHLEKKRYEFEYNQNDILFSVKYDEFTNSKLNMLEVDATNEVERSSFNSDSFPIELVEVTGDMQYYGYRVADLI